MHKANFALAALIGAASLIQPAVAQNMPQAAIMRVPAQGGPSLMVTSSSFTAGGAISDKYTQNGDNVSPALSWSAGPAGTQSYVVLTEDTGVQRPAPIDHWVLYNIPAGTTSLPEAVPTDAALSSPAGAMNGLNIRGASGYIGPKPPAGQTHPYHYEVFALDTTLHIAAADASRDAVVEAMMGHVLASGEIVGNYTGK